MHQRHTLREHASGIGLALARREDRSAPQGMGDGVDIAAWLRELGLECYEQAFYDNDVDLEIRTKLTADDLIAIGVSSVGHRRRLLDAITALRGTPAVAETVEIRPKKSEAERRQLTVMFVDLVGSTALAARLDPEDMGQVIRAYQDTCTEVVERWGGHVAKYMGDGVLAYFGWPQAHEEEAERAVRAGLEVADGVAKLDTPAGKAAARIGIATGRVIVGELIGDGSAQEQTVVGEAPALAARLQALAQPGSVLISQATRRLVGGLFALVDLGPLRLKGFAEPLTAWRVEGEGRAEGRFEALHGEHLTPLVGREHELGILLERWAWAKDGNGQVVLISGEPGIGKSRIVQALLDQISADAHVRLRYFCSAFHVNSALHPVLEHLRRAANLTHDDPAEVKLAKLEAMLHRSTRHVNEAAALIASLLSIPTPDRYPPLNPNPEWQKRRTRELLLEQLDGVSREQPVLAIYEDVQWIDPSSLELLEVLVEQVRPLRVLVVVTFRPEFSPPWTGQPYVTHLQVNRLGRPQCAAMIGWLVHDKALPAEIFDQILEKTDGVPLFVEELTKTVLELGLLSDSGDRFELAGPLTPFAIPASLHDSLTARLDRLSAVKEVAQVGAAIGRDFSRELLAAVAGLPEDVLDQALHQLVSAELVFPRGQSYSFKHALVQDAAYQSLLKSRRRELHARIAQILEKHFREFALTQPELLAHHCTEAQLTDRAIGYWRLAGDQASRRSANVEAVAHFRRGLTLLEAAPDTPANRKDRLNFLVELGPALIATRGAGTPEVEATYQHALDIAENSPASELHFAASWGWWRIASNMRIALERADGLLDLATRMRDEGLMLQAHHCQWATHFHLGNQTDCLKHIESGLQLYDPDRYKHHASIYGGHDPKVCALGERALALWLIGYPDRAITSAERGIRWARQIEHAGSLLHAIDYALMLRRYRREPSRTLALSRRMIELSEQNASDEHSLKGRVFQAWATGILDNPTQGLKEIQRNIAKQMSLGISEDVPVFFDMMAEIKERLGLLEEGMDFSQTGLKGGS